MNWIAANHEALIASAALFISVLAYTYARTEATISRQFALREKARQVEKTLVSAMAANENLLVEATYHCARYSKLESSSFLDLREFVELRRKDLSERSHRLADVEKKLIRAGRRRLNTSHQVISRLEVEADLLKQVIEDRLNKLASLRG